MKPHVFICFSHPLAHKKSLTLTELEDFPYLSFEQGIIILLFSEEILSTGQKKILKFGTGQHYLIW